MFTATRPDVTNFETAVGLDATGRRVRLSPMIVGGSIEVIQAVAVVEDAVADGLAQPLCQRIAERIIGSEEFAGVQSVAIITETYDIIPALADGAPPIESSEHARCAVER